MAPSAPAPSAPAPSPYPDDALLRMAGLNGRFAQALGAAAASALDGPPWDEPPSKTGVGWMLRAVA